MNKNDEIKTRKSLLEKSSQLRKRYEVKKTLLEYPEINEEEKKKRIERMKKDGLSLLECSVRKPKEDVDKEI